MLSFAPLCPCHARRSESRFRSQDLTITRRGRRSAARLSICTISISKNSLGSSAQTQANLAMFLVNNVELRRFTRECLIKVLLRLRLINPPLYATVYSVHEVTPRPHLTDHASA